MQQLLFDNFSRKKERGVITLMSVLIVGALGLTLTVSLLSLGVDSTRTIISQEQSFFAQNYADACGEYALNKLRLSTGYAGGDTLTFSQGSCSVDSVLGSGDTNRTVHVRGSTPSVTRRVKIQIAHITPSLSLTSWEEVGQF